MQANVVCKDKGPLSGTGKGGGQGTEFFTQPPGGTELAQSGNF
jgi:hypothetical protein